MSAESPRHARGAAPALVAPQPPNERSIIDALSGFISDVTLSSSNTGDPKDVIQWARFETADVNEPVPEGEGDSAVSPLILILGYGSGVQVWLVPPSGEAQEVLSWRQGTVRVLRILPTPQHGDCFASKRPLIALCDSASPGPTFCSLSFISIRGGEQVKSIKFKNPILDVLANKRSIVVSFSERFAVFDAATLEDRMAITTCYPCPCPLGGNAIVNPLALGERWLAFADKKLNPSKRSGGGCEGEGVSSYTATVLHAAKSLSKGLRGLGESVASSLGGRAASQSPSPPHEPPHAGLVTILDIESIDEEESQDEEPYDPMVAHFVAHSEAVVAMKFDASGLLLVTADRRGHDFHVFRVHPHPCGPGHASVHHLYVLHRGDTTAKVQDIAISDDGRWAAVSTLRGTTHVFATTPYGGHCGVRTHTQPRVVNRLSRFHRSAGLPIPSSNEHSPQQSDSVPPGLWFPNPRAPPFPAPAALPPLAQLRPTASLPTHTITRTSAGRQRLSSLSEDSTAAPLLARACFGPVGPAPGPAGTKPGPVASLYLVSASGTLTHLMLHPRPARSIPKEKVCDDSLIELEVTPVAAWALRRGGGGGGGGGGDVVAPLPANNPLLSTSTRHIADICMSEEERWLSQVEIVTHAGPHRRLWMGPQFVFKTFNFTGSNSSLSEAETVEVETCTPRAARSTPVNMPCARPIVPVLVDSGSASSLEQSPCEGFRRKSASRERAPGDEQLREDLAEAMQEDHGSGVEPGARRGGVSRCVDPQGTVVRAPPAPARPPPAPAPPPRARAIPAAPAAAPAPAPAARPSPLPTAVLIPAAPAHIRDYHEQDLEPEFLADTRDVCAEISEQERLVEETCERARRELLVYRPPRTETRRARPGDEHAQPDKPAKDVPETTQDNRDAGRNDEEQHTLPAATDDIQPSAHIRLKKSPTPELVSDSVNISFQAVIDSDAPKNKDSDRESDRDSIKQSKSRDKDSKAIDKNKKDSTDKAAKDRNVSKETKTKVKTRDVDTPKSKSSKAKDSFKEIPLKDVDKRGSSEAKDEQSIAVSLPAPSKKQTLESMSSESYEEIKTEDQAWDMLLSEAEKPAVLTENQTVVNEKEVEDTKPKSKKNRQKKTLDTFQSKSDEDSFVEIHAIEDKMAQPSGELVSIPDPLDEKHVDIEPTLSTYSSKSKKLRSSKSATPDKTVEEDTPAKIEKSAEPKFETIKPDKPSFEALKSFDCNISLKPKAYSRKKNTGDAPAATSLNEQSATEPVKTNKSKSLSPVPDFRKTPDADKKDVYVIDTTEMNFPDIQVTKGYKSRSYNKSPQPAARKSLERDAATEKPIKSWSTIAAAKKTDEVEPITTEELTFQMDDDTNDASGSNKDTEEKLSTEVSLQDRLMQLCKRTDIIVAECDVPSGLTFIDEHHTMLHDLPPLEPLDFGLDDFKLEVMRDSLLEVEDRKVTSPLYKINIDDILSSLKETTSKVPESSSAFNLIDLERVPVKKERGFSVIENDKISTQEVRVDNEKKQTDKEEVMEKSSDDDVASPVVSTDSDKEEKKNIGASNTVLPLAKQSAKSKKSRRKKK